jgi:hypothetical protein
MQGEHYQEVRTEASYLEAFKNELIHFHGCIVEGKQPETPLEEGRAHIATLIEIVKQATL